MDTNALNLADIKTVMDGGNGWNGGNIWMIIVLLILFGGSGFGFGRGGVENASLNTDFAILERKQDGLANGICSAQYENSRLAAATDMAMANGFAQTQMSLAQGFANQAQCLKRFFLAMKDFCTFGAVGTCAA